MGQIELFENDLYWIETFEITYERELKSSCNDDISAVDDFLTDEIQALQHQRENCVDLERTMLKKIDFIWLHSIKVSWSGLKPFSWPS